jgi:hypothetical protein
MHFIPVVALTMLAANLSVLNVNLPELPQSPADACALISLEEAGKATGRTFRRARPDKGPGGTTCSLIGGTEGSIAIALSSSSKKDFDDFRKLLTEQGEKVEPVNGVGDEAFYWGDRIHVRSGSQMLVIWNGDSSQPSAKVRADILALAKLGVAKLK